MTAYDEVTKARVAAAIDAALGKTSTRRSTLPKRMTRTKAERLVAALAVVVECEDIELDSSFDEVRAAMERWL